MVMRQRCYGSILGGLLLGMGGLGMITPALIPVTFAQTISSANQGRSLLAELWLLNQGFVSLRPELVNFPDDLAAIDTGETSFDPQLFQGYGARIKQLQEQLRLLEGQLGTVKDEAQRETLATAIANGSQYLNNLASLIQPLETGFNPETIRRLQEFLDFFERRNLNEADYGFYGSVTQTELEEYLDQQLNDFSITLKTLNETATQGAIAPDLATSIEYLYTSLSLENTVLNQGETFQSLIQQLQRDNQMLKGRLRTSNFLLVLLLLLTTATLAFLYTQKPTPSPHPARRYFPDADPEPVDVEQLETAIIKRIQRTYDIKPKLTPVAQSLSPQMPPVESPLPQVTATTEPTTPTTPTAISELPNSEETLAIPDAEFDFPVQFLNPYDALVEAYNQDATALTPEAIALGVQTPIPPDLEDPEAENFLSLLSFVTQEQGEYWAIAAETHHYLVPRANLTITPQNYGIFQQIFVCYGAHPETPQKIKLLKPARVAMTDQENVWELVQVGIVALENMEA